MNIEVSNNKCRELIKKSICLLDNKISTQLTAILHHRKFQQLEGRWRGLHYLVNNTQTSNRIKIKILDITKSELFTDLDDIYFQVAQIEQKVDFDELHQPNGEPFSILIGDYGFSHTANDITLLKAMSELAALCLCPFISAASPALYGLQDWHELKASQELSSIFDTAEYTQWRALRESKHSRFLYLTMPRVLARAPYTANNSTPEHFAYNEFHNRITEPEPQQFTWMNAAFLMGTVLARSFYETGYFLTITGVENGGRIDGLPYGQFNSDDNNISYNPIEIGINDIQESQLTSSGLLPLCHFKNIDSAVFFEARSLHRIKATDDIYAHANLMTSQALPYIMVSSFFAHHIMMMSRHKVYDYIEEDSFGEWLSQWIVRYTLPDIDKIETSGLTEKPLHMYPLYEADIHVEEAMGMPGIYLAILWLRPRLLMGELTTAVKVTILLPSLYR